MKATEGLTWLEHASGTHDDPWQLSHAGEHDHHAAFIGNGLIGCRIAANGDGLHPLDGSASLMAGFWGTSRRKPERIEAQAELPRWAGIRLHVGHRREALSFTQGQQTLDLRHGVVRTSGCYGTVRVEHEAWTARADKHVAVFTVRLTAGDSNATIQVGESLDGLELPGLEAPEVAQTGESLLFSCREKRLDGQLAIASQMRFDTQEGGRIGPERCQGSGAIIRRNRMIWLKPGDSVRVIRVVALANQHHAEVPADLVQSELNRAIEDLEGLRQRHEDAWEVCWQGRIEVPHPRLQRILNAGCYYLYASLREDEPFSHGPCGLTNDGWDGTVFWDTELWTLPPLAFLQPGMAMACARYRYNTLAGAEANAQEHGESGARYAWQSAATGAECCTRPVFQAERHIVSCVARGQWMSALAAGDEAYLLGPGLDVIRACAEYWVSRIAVDADGSAHIRGVCGPDEDAGIVDDNAMTNASAAWTLRMATRLSERAGTRLDPRWAELAEALVIPWDDELDIPKQMAGWQDEQRIKQADATLLAHPWRYPMDPETKARMVEYYRAHYPANQIMMGVAIDAIVDCQIGRAEAAWEGLGQLMQHLHEPFLWVTETPDNENGCFLTGIGGLLQLLIQGFAGVWVDDHGEMHIEPCLPAHLESITLHGLHHEGRAQTLRIVSGVGGTIELGSC